MFTMSGNQQMTDYLQMWVGGTDMSGEFMSAQFHVMMTSASLGNLSAVEDSSTSVWPEREC